jgi:hypothetical protein
MKRAGALLLALAAIGCAEEFEAYSHLSSLRVLALAAEPAAPAPGETTTLSAMVYTPPGVTVTSRAWSWCPFAEPTQSGADCAITEEELAEMGIDAPAYDLGTGETASFTHSIDPAILAAICGAAMPGQEALVDCTGGFPVQVKLVVAAGAETITAINTLRLRFSDDHEPNANPPIDGLVAVIGGSEQPIDAPPGPTFARGEEHEVRAEVPASASESFMGFDDDGDPAVVKERLVLSWFVESGDIADERTAFIDGVVVLEDALVNSWEPDLLEADFDRPTADLIVVVRDSRGGTSWRRGTVTLGAAP